MKTALTIAGSDCSGGAGIQADLKTMTACGVYGMSVITAITAQNTLEVSKVSYVETSLIRAQLKSVFEDIFPDAVKIGMLGTAEIVDTVSDAINSYRPGNVVLDPVMVSTSKSRLAKDDGICALRTKLSGKITLITPNIPEAEVLSGMKIKDRDDMLCAARTIHSDFGCSVLLKGGHAVMEFAESMESAESMKSDEFTESNDLLYTGSLYGGQDEYRWFGAKRIQTRNTHGTGCTLSSAIASNLAKGMTLCEAVSSAKAYVTGALESGLNLGRGNGPLNHAYRIMI